jgi:hypothetical protein
MFVKEFATTFHVKRSKSEIQKLAFHVKHPVALRFFDPIPSAR